MPGCEHERTRSEHAAPVTHREVRRPHRACEVGDREDGEHEPRLQRVEPAPLLEVQREHEEERCLTAPEHELRQQPGAERALAEQPGVEQRRTSAPRD